MYNTGDIYDDFKTYLKAKGKPDIEIPLVLDYEFNKKKYHKGAIKIIEDIEAQTEKEERPNFKKILFT